MAEKNRRILAGIDLAAGRGTTDVALLELTGQASLLRYRREYRCTVGSDEEIIDVLAEAQPAVIAIDAPLSLPAPVATAVRGEVLEERPQGTPTELSTTLSPYTRAAERDPLWSTLGARPLPVSFLGGLTFRALVLVPKLRNALPETAIVEVFPTATLHMLGIRPIVPGAKREAKTSVAARRATQEGLARFVEGLPAVDDVLLGADLLDALAAALTGVAYSRSEFVKVGKPDEGQIVVPSQQFVSRLAASEPGNAR